jgi:hypothetical protein
MLNRNMWLVTMAGALALVVGVGVPSASAVSGPSAMTDAPAGAAEELSEATDIEVDAEAEAPGEAEPPGEAESAPEGEIGSDAEPWAEVTSGAEGEVAPTAEVGVEAASPAALGVTVPAGPNEVVADVMGRGYEQVVRLSGSRVEVREPVSRGSGVLRSFEVGAKREWPRRTEGSKKVPLFYGGSHMADRLVGHSASRLAVVGPHIFVSNLKTRGDGQYSDGSVVRKYTYEGDFRTERSFPEAYAVTALDGFSWQGREYLAIGLNRDGVRVAHADVAGMPDRQAMFEHWEHGGADDKHQVTAVKLTANAADRLLLVAGFMTQDDYPALVGFDVNANRELWTSDGRHRWQNPVWEWPEVMTAGPFGPSGQLQVAVGWPTRGWLSFHDLQSGVDRGILTGGVVSVARFFADASGQPRVGVRRGIGDRFESLVARPDANGRAVVTETGAAADLEWMVPGYRAYTVQVRNRSRAEIDLKMFSGSSRAEGCWLGSGPEGLPKQFPPFPTKPIRLEAGSDWAGPYLTARQTLGEDCTKASPGIFAAQVESPAEPGHRQLVQVEADDRGVRVKDQVGSGRFVVEVKATSPSIVQIEVTDRQAAPTILAAPVVEASRLTPAPTKNPTTSPDDPSRPVHRFTVSGLSWHVPGATAELTGVTLPLAFAEGSVDGQSWASLGTVASPLAPTLDGERVTLGASVFDWQTVGGPTKDYRYFRVKAGTAVSNVIDVSALAVPKPLASEQLNGIHFMGPGAPRANGLDQVPMRVSLLNKQSQALDPDVYADHYRRIYYRDEWTNALITGLGNPDDPTQLVMFSFQPGQYANDGPGADASASIGVYFSTRYPQQNRQVKAMFRSNGDQLVVHPVPLRTATNTLLAEGTGAAGLLVRSCAEGACELKDPVPRPLLHSLTGSTVSVQFRTLAVHGVASLPLTHPDKLPEQLPLLTDTLVFHGSRAMLQNPSRYGPNVTITTDLVTHGERVVAESHPVGR